MITLRKLQTEVGQHQKDLDQTYTHPVSILFMRDEYEDIYYLLFIIASLL